MIVAENLTKYYGDLAAVADVSFSLKEGEVVGLLGLNGAGKTTTLRILSGLLLPTSGQVTVDGVRMEDEPEKARASIGFLPEVPPLYGDMTVEAFLAFVARIKGFSGDLDRAIDDAVAATDLGSVRRDFIRTLSHGYKRRVGIAQALVHKPALILLDEPTSGLDPRQITHMRDLVRNLRGSHTVLVSSHILREVEQICDRIILLRDGRLVASGTREELAAKVAASNKVRVEVRGGAQELAAALAKVKDAVKGHQIDHEGDGVTGATIELAGDAREELAKALVDSGLGLRGMQRVQLELESTFLQLTEEGSKEVSA